MLHLTAAERMDRLAAALAEVLAVPPTDPMAPEWIVVGSAATDRWLRLELARHLGAAGPGTGDGVAANLDLLFPGTLTRRLLHPGAERERDPWHVDAVAWTVLEVLDGRGDDERLGPVRHLPPGGTPWGRARRLADLLDRYLLHRPAMVRAWTDGRDVDGTGVALGPRWRWQPHLWRLVRERIDVPSPAELAPTLLDAVRRGEGLDEVPERVSLFGLSTIPGGRTFLDLLDALGRHREVHLLLHQPSLALADRVRSSLAAAAVAPTTRTEDPTAEIARHPLLRAWARPAREAAVLAGDRAPSGLAHDDAGQPGEPTTLLGRLQADLRADRAPAGDHVLDPADRSVLLHSCHGPGRQVEVLRDQLLHLLADDPTLTEDDVVVLCPALDELAPWIESVLGPPAGVEVDEAHGAPRLAYRITDRSLRSTVPLLGALGALVELLASRFSAAAVLDFADLAPVRERFGFTDADLASLARWVDAADARWGLDGEHRSRWGIPATHRDGSWAAMLDRLLLGIATSDDASALAPGEVLPLAVEGDGIALAGRVADLLGRLAALVDAAAVARPIDGWLALLRDAVDQLLAVDADDRWQRSRLDGILEAVAVAAAAEGRPCPAALTLTDVRHLLGRQLGGMPGRSDFFRGGVTFSSLTPLRGLPYRVVCLLGMDEGAFAAGAPDGDDLVAVAPHLGDRDRRSDLRLGLLEAVQAAQQHLVVVRTGHSVVTNQPVPRAVVVAELVDVLAATVTGEQRDALRRDVELVHPRQPFDERNFLAVGSPLARAADGPWGFDPLARDGAEARRLGLEPPPLLAEPLAAPDLPVVELAELRSFLEHPPRHFLRDVLGLAVPRVRRGTGKLVAPAVGATGIPRPAEGRDLLLEVDVLDRWNLRDRLLAHLRGGGDEASFARRERASGSLPPGRRGDEWLAAAIDEVTPLVDRLDALGALRHPPLHRLVDLVLADGTRLVGTVRDDRGDVTGPITTTVSSTVKPTARLAPWLDSLVLAAAEPAVPSRAVLLSPSTSKAKGRSTPSCAASAFEVVGDDPDERRRRALDALGVVVDLLRRGHREPLPLFPRLSWALHNDNSPSSAWQSGIYSTGDDADEWLQVAFQHASLEHVTTLPLRHDDPAGAGDDRATRFAHVLWGTYDDVAAGTSLRGAR